ncbi:aminodeoxychorismate lyase [Candidatus Blochmanniella camponoti]|uniref:Aminodeoxychorismate lyase n=1 Tax=Candidatus Blochmanniella camponoti TaxID=108080 RepID=A0AAE9L6A0_9ENTR|nr:aminodeoxychorismate lyase [Candidatus Blochmannia herculeanus]URJ24251.1 aminodeoxychorismate lyase [Candidatus Blochmannia herculeanus]URJ27138.1 aminodeoxychorismate lyase [Candidatus Blochmannia herculeanus]URJ27607.1 aminodeoxychorismate lyase [Candidatus Blochmannia herculeanus]
MYWVNGISKKTISLNNRALHFGDGFFTTAKVQNGKIDFLDWHMDRLVISAKRLIFNNFNFNLLHKEMQQAAAYNDIYNVIKVIISRSNSHRLYGYRCNNDIEPLRIIHVSRLPKYYTRWIHSGIRLRTSTVRLARNSCLAGIKHLNRLEQVMIAIWVSKNDTTDEALVLDTDGNVVECCSANIFWRYKYQVFTPSLYYSGVNGTMRQLVLKLLPKLGYCIREVTVGPEHLKNANEVFITNALLPLAPVNSIDDCVYSDRTLFHLLRFHIIHNKI